MLLNATVFGSGSEMEDFRLNKILTEWVYVLSNDLENYLKGFLILFFARLIAFLFRIWQSEQQYSKK